MACSFSDTKPSGGQRSVFDELIHGRELTFELQSLLSNDQGSVAVSAEDLVAKIMKSLSDSLSMLTKNRNENEINDVVSQVQAGNYSPANSSPCWDGGRKSEDSGESCKSSSNHKDRRGSYKRRKTSNSWKKDTPTLTDDGHAWRKYGQKVILNANYPRNYFRCTHKYDQGCLATKQVQRIQDDPQMFRTTYYGNHTCRNLNKAPELILDCTSPRSESSNLFSFDNPNLATKQNPFFPTFPVSSIKKESKDENVPPSNCGTMTLNQTSSSRYILSSPDHHHHHDHHLTGFEQSSTPLSAVLSSTLESDVISFDDDEDIFLVGTC
ncbi:hypothetical protein UlMin_000759 [Ulmus minor]